MTKQEAFQQAKSIVLTAMSQNLRTENVSYEILFFGAEKFDINSIDRLERIDGEIDYLIKRLNCLKARIESAKQVIRDAE